MRGEFIDFASLTLML